MFVTKIHERESGIRKATLLKDLVLGSVEEIGESGQDHRYGFGRLDVLWTIDFALERGYGRIPKESRDAGTEPAESSTGRRT
jgi:hypothetical protein